MNREIKFRGKRKDKINNEWYYGYLIVEIDNTYWIDYFVDRKRRTVEIIPESVGQFTGLKDKNDVKIFEGDIVICKGHKCTIKYRDNFCDFVMDINKYGGRLLNLTKANITWHKIEVIV